MNLGDITTKCFILALIIRDDGQRLLLGDGYYEFKHNLQHFQPNTYQNDVVELQGTDGQLLAGQVRRTATQNFNGYIGDATVNRQTIEQKRREFMTFFRKKHFYKVVYIFPDGTAIQRKRGYIVNAPSVPEMWQRYPEYSIGINFEDVNYYEYAEDELGDEIYAHIVQIALAAALEGGLVWDAIGAVSDGITWSNIQTAQGEYISLNNALDREAPLASVQIDGNATQSGTPTPDSPVAVQTTTGENVVKIEGSDDSQEFEVNLGKNLFGAGSINYVAYGSATIANNKITLIPTGDGNPQVRLALIQTIPAGTYTLNSSTALATSTILRTTDGNTTTYNFGSGYQNKTFTTTQSSGYIWFNFTNPQNTNPITIDLTTLQIERGTSVSSYAPYFEPIELAKIGNYQDRIYKDGGKWYIEKQVGKVVLDGSENWGNQTGSHTTVLNLYCPTASWGALASERNPLLCTIATYSLSAGANNDTTPNICKLNLTGSNFLLDLAQSSFATLDDFKTWLSSHPTTVYYALATPTTTEITEQTLIDQLDALGNAKLFVGQNNIGTTTLNATPTLELEYYGDYSEEGAGYEWEAGGGSQNIITVDGVDNALPIWTVIGPASNPTLTNITTGQTISWQGFVPNGQTLTIDMNEMTAYLAGANVFEYITGTWLELQPGNNTLVYNAGGGAEADSTLSWNGVAA